MFRPVFFAVLCGLFVIRDAYGQGDAAVPTAQPAQARPTASARPDGSAPQPETPSGAAGAKPSGEGEPAGGKPPEGADEKKADDAAVIRRQSLAATQGNPKELSNAVLDSDGRVAFQFRNQGWPDLIDWLAELSGQPLDWQELPGDRVNITTPGRYTVQEVVDLLNRHLLGRGYTLLALDGGMTVVKCASLNPAIVPRVAPEMLGSIPPHSFVRTTLDVGWLSAEKLAEELKAMISANGKLTALTTTNRIEAIDAAITLRQIAELLAYEQGTGSRESLVPEFRLRHIPAEEAKKLLEQFLGISSKPEPAMTPQQMQQAQQMAQMRAQQGGGGPPTPEPKKAEISVVANARQNSILILAPPDRVAIATEFLKRIDVPGNSLTALSDVQSRVQVFRLVSLDPEKLIEIVQEMNVLEPTTRIRVDSANRALIVSGSAADRFIIDQLIKRLDGSGRRLEVLQLRRLEAADVAESISFLMGKKEEKEDSNRNRYSYYFSEPRDTDKKKDDEFRVAANTRFRQVLLWATEAEMAEVRNLLVKLGELPPPGGSDRMIRIIDADITPETHQYLRGLEQQWRRLAPNPLLIPASDLFESQSPGGAAAQAGSTDNETTDTTEPASPVEPAAKPPEDGSESQTPRVVPTTDLSAAAQVTPVGSVSDAFDSSQPIAERLTAMQTAPEQDAAPSVLNESAMSNGGLGEIRSAEDFDRAFLTPAVSPNQIGQAATDNAAEQLQQASGAAGAPIRIELDAAGNLVLSSSDTDALDQLETVMLQFAPPKRAYHVFTTHHASATWVKLNLEDYFKEEEDKKEDNSFTRWYFGFDDTSKKSNTPGGLGKPAKLRFIADNETGTIVVSNASAEQLRSIHELIKLWDVPEPVNKRTVRYTRLVPLQYGRAARIAETIKETYRDLLSSNDKAFQQAQPRQDGGATPQKNDTPRARALGGGSELVDTGGSGQQGGGADFSFKGKLSLGVDEVGNTLLVSAEGEPLLKLVCDMIDQLDKACLSSDGVQVVNLSGSINSGSLEAALRAMRAGTQINGLDKPRSAAGVKPPNGADGPDG
jgi:type II secretory pathway component GspD/PulD (secretin)